MTKITTSTKKEIKEVAKEVNVEPIKLRGKYLSATGKRKEAVARIRLYKKGKGLFIVNNKKINDYFTQDNITVIKQPLKLTKTLKDFDFSISVKGGGKNGQSEAVRHGISKVLLEINEENKAVLKTKGLLTRDARTKERKKPGLKKARRRPQWSKR